MIEKGTYADTGIAEVEVLEKQLRDLTNEKRSLP